MSILSDIQSIEKVGRNSPCPCNSGKKFKHCCVSRPPVSAGPKLPALKLSRPVDPLLNQLAMAASLSFKDILSAYKTDEAFIRKIAAALTGDHTMMMNRDESYTYLTCQIGSETYSLRFNADGKIEYDTSHKGMHFYEIILVVMINSHVQRHLNLPTPAGYFTACSKTICTLLSIPSPEHPPLALKSIILVSGAENLTAATSAPTLIKGTVAKGFADKRTDINNRRYLWDQQIDNFSRATATDGTLQYYFSDGSIINARELLFHPYALLIPNTFLLSDETTSNHPGEFFPWINSDIQKPSREGGEYFAELIARIAAPENFGRYQLMIASSAPSGVGLNVLTGNNRGLNVEYQINVLQNVTIWAAKDLQWEIGRDLELKISLPKPFISRDSGIAPWTDFKNGWLFDPGALMLAFSPVPEFHKHWMFQTTIPVPQIQQSDLTYRMLMNDIRQLDQLQSALISVGAALAVKDFPIISATDIAIECHYAVDKPDLVAIVLKTPFETTETKVLRDNLAHRICRDLNSGLKDLSYYAKEAATKQNKDKRAQELKLLRHQGFLRVLISEIELYYRDPLKNVKSRSQAKKEIFSGLERRAKLMGLLPGVDGFSDAYSTKILRLINEMIEKYLPGANRQSFFEIDGRIVCVDLADIELKLSTQLITLLTQAFGQEFLTKPANKSVAVVMPIEPSQAQNDLAVLHPQSQKLLLASINGGLPVYIDGQPIAEVNPESLTAELSIDSGNSGDWFDLHPQVFFDGNPINEDEARQFVSGGLVRFRGKFYLVDRNNMPSAKWLEYFWANIQGASKRPKDWEATSNIVTSAPHQILKMLALKRAGVPVIGGTEWQKISAAFDRLAEEDTGSVVPRDEIKQATGIPLKSFQEHGAQWMLNIFDLGLGGILADDMGLGKTVQTLAFLRSLQLRGELGRCLIVVPPSLLYNWQCEIKRFCPELEYSVFSSNRDLVVLTAAGQRAGGLLLTTYNLVCQYEQEFSGINWNIGIFDEAQYLKNIRAKRTGALRQLRVRTKFCLTGTPLENHYGEFFSLMDLCVPGCLGSYEEFAGRYVNPSAMKIGSGILREDVEFLRLMAAPLVLRRSKSKILDQLPEKTETVVKLAFEPEQKTIYRDTAIAWNKDLQDLMAKKGEAGAQLQMLTALLRLRQICSHPGTVPKIEYRKIPPKFELLIDTLRDLSEKGEAVIVFTSFRKTLDLLEEQLKASGVFCLSISGSTPLKKRSQILEQFEKASGHVILLMTQKVGGIGLNLTKARYVFHLEPWWNPQVENQATDRVHRIGQKRSVQIYRYLMAESVEEKIESLKDKKSKLFDDLFACEGDIGETGFANNRLSKKDFEFLLTTD